MTIVRSFSCCLLLRATRTLLCCRRRRGGRQSEEDERGGDRQARQWEFGKKNFLSVNGWRPPLAPSSTSLLVEGDFGKQQAQAPDKAFVGKRIALRGGIVLLL
ncbi:hypothetical protein DFJ73DRAFT_557537 [Zopfochytrium polystomum]|nr:hypothetical protein DFJ73DRAFT_557537 [Zopfochytrium polystomum]